MKTYIAIENYNYISQKIHNVLNKYEKELEEIDFAIDVTISTCGSGFMQLKCIKSYSANLLDWHASSSVEDFEKIICDFIVKARSKMTTKRI